MSSPIEGLIHISLLRLLGSNFIRWLIASQGFTFLKMALALDLFIRAEEISSTVEGGIDDILRYAVVFDVEEASPFASISQLRYQVRQGVLREV